MFRKWIAEIWKWGKKRRLLNKMRYYFVISMEEFNGVKTRVFRTLFGYVCPKCSSNKNYVSCTRRNLQPRFGDFIEGWKECWDCGYRSGISQVDWLG